MKHSSSLSLSLFWRAGAAALALMIASGCDSGTDSEPVEKNIRSMLNSLDARTALYAKHLPTGREIAIRADEPVNTLSVIKVPIMILAYRDARQGRLDLDAQYQVRPDDMRRGSGILQHFAPGLAPTYRDLITQMIVTSDNTATDIMIAKVGLDRVNQLLTDLGYVETRLQHTTGDLFRGVWELTDPAHVELSHREVFERGWPNDPNLLEKEYAFDRDSKEWLGRTTAREMSRLLEQIHNGEVASREDCDEMLDILGKQLYESRLPRYISFQAAVAHKTGDWPPISGNDVGIISGSGGPIVVSIFASQNRGSFYDLEDTEGRIAEMLLNEWQ
jgi:beta-lactamase class A